MMIVEIMERHWNRSYSTQWEGPRKALKLLFEHDEVKKFLDDISGKAAWQYKQDKEDLRQHLQLTILKKIKSLKRPQSPLNMVPQDLTNHCLDIIKKYKNRGKTTAIKKWLRPRRVQ